MKKIVIFDTINIYNLLFVLLASLFYKIYYINIDLRVYKTHWLKFILNKVNCLPFPIEFSKEIGSFNLFDYGDADYTLSFAKDILSKNLIDYFRPLFDNIEELDNKLILSLISTFNYHGLGNVAILSNVEFSNYKIIYIHNNIKSYLFRNNAVFFNSKIEHRYFLVNSIEYFFKGINFVAHFLIKIFRTLFSNLFLKRINNLENEHIYTNNYDVSVLYHSSIQYGNHFIKNQYFSDDINSRLHESKVLKFVIFPEEINKSFQTNTENNLVLLNGTNKLKDYLLVLKNISIYLFNNKLIIRTSGLVYLSLFSLEYLRWKRSLVPYSALKNVIYDYDVLVPKSLSLALESLNIKTLALQERSSFSFSNIYGVIVDTYFIGSGFYYIEAIKNNMIIAKNKIEFGQWRAKYFYDNNAMYAIILAGVFMLSAAISVLYVQDN